MAIFVVSINNFLRAMVRSSKSIFKHIDRSESNLFSSLSLTGYQSGRLGRYYVLRARCSFFLGLDIFRLTNCGKYYVLLYNVRRLGDPEMDDARLALTVWC